MTPGSVKAVVHKLHEKNWGIGVGISICSQVLDDIGVVDATKEATLEFKSVKQLSMFFTSFRSLGLYSKRTGNKSLAAQISSSHFALQTAP